MRRLVLAGAAAAAGAVGVLVWLWHDAALRVERGLCPYQECAEHRVPFERAFDDDGWWR